MYAGVQTRLFFSSLLNGRTANISRKPATRGRASHGHFENAHKLKNSTHQKWNKYDFWFKLRSWSKLWIAASKPIYCYLQLQTVYVWPGCILLLLRDAFKIKNSFKSGNCPNQGKKGGFQHAADPKNLLDKFSSRFEGGGQTWR